MANFVTWMFCTLAATKCPSSWNATILARTPIADPVDPSPAKSKAPSAGEHTICSQRLLDCNKVCFRLAIADKSSAVYPLAAMPEVTDAPAAADTPSKVYSLDLGPGLGEAGLACADSIDPAVPEVEASCCCVRLSSTSCPCCLLPGRAAPLAAACRGAERASRCGGAGKGLAALRLHSPTEAFLSGTGPMAPGACGWQRQRAVGVQASRRALWEGGEPTGPQLGPLGEAGPTRGESVSQEGAVSRPGHRTSG